MITEKSTERMVRLMEEKKVGIDDVSAATNICIKRLKEYIAGCFDNISVTETVLLAEYFDISPSYLMGWIDYRVLKYKIHSHSFTYRNMASEDADRQFIRDLIDRELLCIEKAE